MASARQLMGSRQWRARAMLYACALAMLGMNGCARLGGRSSVVVTPPVSSVAPAEMPRERSLATIVNNELQLGHYSEGEKALRWYLKQHPGDRAAQAMLRQLTADPRQMLGDRWRPHVVQSGDSYSTLATRYLGDPNLFLILARYNNSSNPSMLRAGETLHMPASAKGTSSAPETPPAVPGDDDRGAIAAAPQAIATPATELPAAKARRLQNESVALLDQGHKDQALARLGEALAIEPRLKPVDTKATTLRTQLLGSYHERAIVLYRDQQLEQAIALWNRVLAIDPGYEPAIAYRARARELQHRLKQY
ncbi:LysM domain-containing protein [Rhodanobacter glycinis]|nr:LysM domain-containing protein [Rhodanobacter glycinis]